MSCKGVCKCKNKYAAIDRLEAKIDEDTIRVLQKVDEVAVLVNNLRSLAAELYLAGASMVCRTSVFWDGDGKLKKKAEALGVMF